MALLTYWVWYAAKRLNEACNSDQNSFKRRRISIYNSVVTPPTSNAMYMTSEKNRYHPLEQNRQFSTSRNSSLQRLPIDTNPPYSFGYRASSDGYNSTNKNGRAETPMDDIGYQESILSQLEIPLVLLEGRKTL